ncbi:polysaccharide deacetylase family protein [bacterium]|nr:polysaccharide deacetylase family protein [bacterium]
MEQDRSQNAEPRTLVLLTVDTEASMAGLRPLPPEAMVYGRVDDQTLGIERIMDCCEARGMPATFFLSALEARHYGDDHVRQMAAMALERGHDAQLHVHPVWLPESEGRKALTDYDASGQRAAIEAAAGIFRRTCEADLVAHRAGGLWANADTFTALEALGIPLDSSVALGYHHYDVPGVANVPRRIGAVAEAPVTAFAQMRLGPWQTLRNFDINPDTVSELTFVVDRAVAAGVTAVTLLMHSFAFVGRNADSSRFWPALGELRKFERFLDALAARDDVEVVTVSELARRAAAEPELLAGPDFLPNAGVGRTWLRSCERFGASWKNKAFAVGLPLAVAAAASLLVWMLR